MRPRRLVPRLVASFGLVSVVAVGTLVAVAFPTLTGHLDDLAHVPGRTQLSLHLAGILGGALLAAAAAALVASTLVALILARGLSAPITEMVRATRRFAAGDHRQRVRPGGTEELRELAASLNEMASGLERVEQLRRELVANVAHELRTPLAGIDGYIEAFSDGVLEPNDQNLARVRGECLRLRRLVDDLTTLSQVESAETRVALTHLDLAEVVDDAVRLLAPAFDRKGVELRPDPPPATLPVLADRARLTQVLTNLLSNALQFTPPGGRVRVSPRREGGHAAVEVSDTGIGIAPEDVPRIFERFYRADGARAHGSGGAGIGLAIVKHLVEAQAGIVRVTSELGAGSRFVVLLPLVSEPTASAVALRRDAEA